MSEQQKEDTAKQVSFWTELITSIADKISQFFGKKKV